MPPRSVARTRLVVFPELSLTGYELDAQPLKADDRVFQPIQHACAASDAVALVGAPVVGSDGVRHIATVRVTSTQVDIVQRKMSLGGDEQGRFCAGNEPTVLELDGLAPRSRHLQGHPH